MKRSFPFLRTQRIIILNPNAASQTTIEIKKKEEYNSIITKIGDKLKKENKAKAINSNEIKEDKMCLNTKKKTIKAIININENIRVWLWLISK